MFGYNEPQITEPRYVRLGLFAGNGGSEADFCLGSLAVVSEPRRHFRSTFRTGPNHCESTPRRSHVGYPAHVLFEFQVADDYPAINHD